MWQNKPVIGITMGDPAGIGPEIVLKALFGSDILDHCIPVIYGDRSILEKVAALLNLKIPQSEEISSWRKLTKSHFDQPVVVNCQVIDESTEIQPGTISAVCGSAAYRYIVEAIEDALANRIDAVVTAPIHKEALHAAGITYPGHTEIFATLTNTTRYCMMLACEEFCVGFVTTHVALAKVPHLLTTEKIFDTIKLTANAARKLRGKSPRLIVCGLNPHAGEGGIFGDEELRCIIPAIKLAQQEGFVIEGPLPPDSAFLPERLKQTDAYIAMYHDQGHIPFKMHAFDRGVNITLGLPIVRTSVDHGTAFDIAWQNRANPSSLIQAIRYALKLIGQNK